MKANSHTQEYKDLMWKTLQREGKNHRTSSDQNPLLRIIESIGTRSSVQDDLTIIK